jgi:CHAT domain-containing protein
VPEAPRERRALVVADPRGDLPGASREAAAARTALRAAGWSVAALSGAAAGVDPTLAAVARADLFHFAGHAAAGGADQGGELLLSGGRLASPEVLALPRVPRWVVLAGCETAVADRGAPTEGLAIAHAFLLRGARQVVAAVRPVPDGATAALFASLYAGGAPGADLAVLLARAQAAALASGHAEAASFRLYEP